MAYRLWKTQSATVTPIFEGSHFVEEHPSVFNLFHFRSLLDHRGNYISTLLDHVVKISGVLLRIL